MINYLREELKHKDKELFVVVTQEVELTRDWCVTNSAFSTNNSVGGRDILPQQNNTSTNNLVVNGQEPRLGDAFNPPGLSYIDQESSVPENWLVEEAMKASQETL